MSGSTNVDCRRPQTSGSRQIDKEYHLRRLEIIKTIGRVCHTGMKDLGGEVMEIFLGTRDWVITDASFLTNGYILSILCGYTASKLAIGKTADEALKIDADTILESLGQIPEDEAYCTRLAAEALHCAIRSWIYSEQGTCTARKVNNEH